MCWRRRSPGGRLSDRGADRRQHRAQQGADQASGPIRRSSSSCIPASRARRRWPGEMFRQPDLAATLAQARAGREAWRWPQARIAKPRSMPPTTASIKATSRRSSCARPQELGGLITLEISPTGGCTSKSRCTRTYRGIEVYKLNTWVQGPVMLQTLNILENFDLKAMGYNSARYIHTLYQAMNLAFADRDFYYGDPYFPPEEPIRGLLSKDYARERAKLIHTGSQRSGCAAWRSLSVPGRQESLLKQLQHWQPHERTTPRRTARAEFDRHFHLGTTSRRGGGCRRLGRVGHAERRLGAGGHCRTHRRRDEPARAELRARCGRESLQRDRARQTTARDADAGAGAEGRQAVPVLRRAGRRRAGSGPAAVLPERGRIRHDAAGSDRSGEHHQLPDAQFVRQSRVEPGAHGDERRTPPLRAHSAYKHGL